MNGFYITIKNGLLDPKHIKNMKGDLGWGTIWLFLWFIDKMTIVNDEIGEGKVLGGKPIRFEDVQKDLGISRATYKRWLTLLKDCGYIQTTRSPHGLTVVVYKAFKVFGQKADSSPESHQEISDGQDKSHHSQAYREPSHIRQYSRQDNIDKSIGDKSPKAEDKTFGNQEIDLILEDFKRNKGHIPADKKPRQVAQNIRQITETFVRKHKALFLELRGEELTKQYVFDKFYLNLKQKKYIDDIEKLETVKLKLRVYLDVIASKLLQEKQRKGEAHGYQAN